MRILIAEDDEVLLEEMARFLSDDLEHQVTRCVNGREALNLYQDNPFPMVVSDIRMPEIEGIELLKKLKKLPEGGMSDVVLITGYANLDAAIEALRAGAYDFLRKPFRKAELAAVVERVAEHQSLIRENYELTHRFKEKVADATNKTESRLKRLESAYARVMGLSMVGVFSSAMRAMVEIARRLHEDRSMPVLIEGETGTGKEILARLVHYGEGDVTTPFISINCSAITPSLFESELFGYEPGAFTGAKKAGSIGKLELAQGGTLFLDEIGDLPLEMQPKLLRVLQEMEIYRIGGLKKIQLDVRVICATNRDLDKLIAQGGFRRDLFYRLNKGRLYIPPLRERKEAVAPMARMFLERFAEQKKRRFRTINLQAVKLLQDHSWPGNIRELENAIERVVLLYDEVELTAEHLSFLLSGGKDLPLPQGPVLELGSIRLPDKELGLRELEAEIVQKALAKFNGNKTRTAAYLGISRGALINRLKRAY
jgi:two-component system, NtrC family, response regulator AtoC